LNFDDCWRSQSERRPHHDFDLPPHTSAIMATSYENLPLEDDEFDESQIDFADIEEQFQVRLDEGLDAFVVIDGLPVVPEDSKAKLVKFVLRKLNTVGKVKDDGVHMPVGDSGKTEGYVGGDAGGELVLVCAPC
jgi:hypothetical protein